MCEVNITPVLWLRKLRLRGVKNLPVYIWKKRPIFHKNKFKMVKDPNITQSIKTLKGNIENYLYGFWLGQVLNMEWKMNAIKEIIYIHLTSLKRNFLWYNDANWNEETGENICMLPNRKLVYFLRNVLWNKHRTNCLVAVWIRNKDWGAIREEDINLREGVYSVIIQGNTDFQKIEPSCWRKLKRLIVTRVGEAMSEHFHTLLVGTVSW